MYLGLPQLVYLHCLHGKNGIFQSGFLISDIGSSSSSRHPDAFPKSNPPLQPVALLNCFLRMFAKFAIELLRRCPSWFWDWTRRSNKCVNSVMRHVFQPDQSMSLYTTLTSHWPFHRFSYLFSSWNGMQWFIMIHHDSSRFPHKDLHLWVVGESWLPAVVHFNRVAPNIDKFKPHHGKTWHRMTKHYIKIR